MTDLKEINEEINRLNVLKKEIHDKKYADKKEEFLKLDWISEQTLLYEDGITGYGFPSYIIRGIIPEKYKDVFIGCYEHYLISGDSKDCYQNILIKKSYGENLSTFEISTSNTKAFIEFIKKYNLRVNFYPNFKDKLAVYKALDEVSRL